MPLGYRIGKGEGFTDLEYALMAYMGAVSESTTVVTIVHDCQVSNVACDHCQILLIVVNQMEMKTEKTSITLKRSSINHKRTRFTFCRIKIGIFVVFFFYTTK